MNSTTLKHKPRLDEILSATADAFGYSPEAITSPCRARELVMARGIVSLIAHPLGYTYERIGRKLNRSHASVMFAKTRADFEVRNYPEITDKYKSVITKLGTHGIAV